MYQLKRLTIRSWWSLVIWYVRLRRAAGGQTPYKLLDVEMHLQKDKMKI